SRRRPSSGTPLAFVCFNSLPQLRLQQMNRPMADRQVVSRTGLSVSEPKFSNLERNYRAYRIYSAIRLFRRNRHKSPAQSSPAQVRSIRTRRIAPNAKRRFAVAQRPTDARRRADARRQRGQFVRPEQHGNRYRSNAAAESGGRRSAHWGAE